MVFQYFDFYGLMYVLLQIEYLGGNVMLFMSKVIENVKKVLFIFFQNSNNVKFLFEIFFVLEKCVKYDQFCLIILIFCGFECMNIVYIFMLQNVIIVELDYNC